MAYLRSVKREGGDTARRRYHNSAVSGLQRQRRAIPSTPSALSTNTRTALLVHLVEPLSRCSPSCVTSRHAVVRTSG